MVSASSDARSEIEALDLRTSDRVKRLRAEVQALSTAPGDHAGSDSAYLSAKIQQARLEGIWDALYALASRIDAEAGSTR